MKVLDMSPVEEDKLADLPDHKYIQNYELKQRMQEWLTCFKILSPYGHKFLKKVVTSTRLNDFRLFLFFYFQESTGCWHHMHCCHRYQCHLWSYCQMQQACGGTKSR